MPDTFYWHDYETFGRSAALDRPVQFAGLRTDGELREIGEPLLLFCRPPADYLPQPDACLVHGISPQEALAKGLPEREFIARIHAEFARPGTCGVGYNSIRFDDEFTRFTLFRNFHDPYAREYRDGNSRWDLLDVLRMARLLRPEGLEWPDRADGRPSFRLEDLAPVNGIEHGAAHEALADVRATLALARKLRAAQPKLFAYALKARDKNWVFSQLDLRARQPVLHVSQRFPSQQGCAALVVPVAMHPFNRNSVIVCNLLHDPAPLLELDPEALRERLFARAEDLPEGVPRLPLKEIHANRSPMIAPAAMLDAERAGRYGIDLAQCEEHLARIRAAGDLGPKLRELYRSERPPASDPELDLYGAFVPDGDRRLLAAVRAADPDELAHGRFAFADARLPEMLFRYRARNFPESLDAGERAAWQEHCAAWLHGPGLPGRLDCEAYRDRLAELRRERAGDARDLRLIAELELYGKELCDACAAA